MEINYLDNINTTSFTIKDLIESKNNNKYLFLKEDVNKRKIYIYKLNNVLLTGISINYPNLLLYSNTDNKIYLPIKEKTMSLNKDTIYTDYNMKYDLNINDKNKLINNDFLFFFNYNTDNYFHFLYDSLSILYSFIHMRKILSEIKLLMYYPSQKVGFCKFVYEFLELLNITKNDIVIIDQNYLYENIFISTSYTHDNNSNANPRKEIFEVYKLIAEKALSFKVNIDLPKKIYISRRTWKHNNLSNIGTNYTTRRLMINENKLVDKLIDNKYSEIFTENLSTIEKIHIFNNAESVVGAIGGGIANIIFSNSNCKLIAIISPIFLEINTRFKFCLDSRINEFKNNNIYFTKCFHENNNSIYKKYMRVKILNTNYIGEITNIDNNNLEINITNGTNTGWNSTNKYKSIIISSEKVEKLDNGLNSPFIVNLDELMKYIY